MMKMKFSSLKLFNTNVMRPNSNMFSGFNKLSFKNFYFQNPDRHGAGDAHIVAKRVINVIGRVLRESDPHRWEGVPVTFETKWVETDTPYRDIRTSILIHDALEKEFNIDIDDRKKLLGSIKETVNLILEYHTAI